jgi:hypothetical protein
MGFLPIPVTAHREACARTLVRITLCPRERPMFDITDLDWSEARRLADLAITLALELSSATAADSGGWISSTHEALLAIASASGGYPPALHAAVALLDRMLEPSASRLLRHAALYAAFWDD